MPRPVEGAAHPALPHEGTAEASVPPRRSVRSFKAQAAVLPCETSNHHGETSVRIRTARAASGHCRTARATSRGAGSRTYRSAVGDAAGRSGRHGWPIRQWPALLRSREQGARAARRAAARRQRRVDPRGRRPAGARALRRAHGLQRHEELPEAGAGHRSWNRSACASGRASMPTRASTKPSTCCRCRRTAPDVMEKAFQILQDWAQHVSFDADEIDKERGVIMEEWRLGRGAGARMHGPAVPDAAEGTRATPSGCRSASPRCCRSSRTRASNSSTPTGTART